MRRLLLTATFVLGFTAVPSSNATLHANPQACSNCIDIAIQYVQQGYMTAEESVEWMLICYDVWNCHNPE